MVVVEVRNDRVKGGSRGFYVLRPPSLNEFGWTDERHASSYAAQLDAVIEALRSVEERGVEERIHVWITDKGLFSFFRYGYKKWVEEGFPKTRKEGQPRKMWALEKDVHELLERLDVTWGVRRTTTKDAVFRFMQERLPDVDDDYDYTIEEALSEEEFWNAE